MLNVLHFLKTKTHSVRVYLHFYIPHVIIYFPKFWKQRNMNIVHAFSFRTLYPGSDSSSRPHSCKVKRGTHPPENNHSFTHHSVLIILGIKMFFKLYNCKVWMLTTFTLYSYTRITWAWRRSRVAFLSIGMAWCLMMWNVE